jgi:pimeloyl-ACP methyl ester carboxylesterase
VSEPLRIGGIDLHVDGDGSDTILMIHGWPDTYLLWSDQVAALKDRYRCARFTLPGYGAGDDRRTRTLDELTGTLKRVVDELSPQRPVILMLHDWGCVFGYEFYTRHPARVSRIIGVDIGDLVSLGRSLTPAATAGLLGYQLFLATAWLIGGATGDAMTRWMARRLRCPADPALIGARMNYPYFMTWFGGAHSYRQLQPFAPQVPMLFVCGRRKPFMFHAPSWIDALRGRPGCAVVEFDTGHWVMVEQPRRFNEVVGAWLRDASGD